MELNAYEKDVMTAKICPYCKSGTKLMSELQVYGKTYSNRIMHVCKNYPVCDAYVGSHENGISLGRLANKSLRIMKKRAHQAFDKLWKDKYLDRKEAYYLLSEHLNIPKDYTHIGMFSELTCKKVIQWSNEQLAELQS